MIITKQVVCTSSYLLTRSSTTQQCVLLTTTTSFYAQPAIIRQHGRHDASLLIFKSLDKWYYIFLKVRRAVVSPPATAMIIRVSDPRLASTSCSIPDSIARVIFVPLYFVSSLAQPSYRYRLLWKEKNCVLLPPHIKRFFSSEKQNHGWRVFKILIHHVP